MPLSRNFWWSWITLVVGVLVTGTGLAEEPKAAREYRGRTLAQWHEEIKSTDHHALGNPQTVAALIEIIQDGQAPWGSRRLAALTLGRIGKPAATAVPVFVQLLDADEADPQSTRLWALAGLALLGNVAESAVPPVAEIILDDAQSHPIRMNAMETLGRIGQRSPRTLPVFLQILRSQPTAETDVQSHRERRLAAAEGLWYLQSSAATALPELLLAARDPWPLLRLGAVTTIGEIGPAAEIAVPALVDLVLFDEAGEVREAAADALGRIGPAAIPTFRQLIDDPDVEVRRLAIRGLTQVSLAEQVRPILEVALEDSSHLVRVEAAALLVKDDAFRRAALEQLLAGLTADQRATRITAYRALQQQSDQLAPSRPFLEELTTDPQAHPQSRTAAIHLLKLIDAP